MPHKTSDGSGVSIVLLLLTLAAWAHRALMFRVEHVICVVERRD